MFYKIGGTRKSRVNRIEEENPEVNRIEEKKKIKKIQKK